MDSFFTEMDQIRLNKKDGSLHILNDTIAVIMNYLASERFSTAALHDQLKTLSAAFPDFAILHHFITSISKKNKSRNAISEFISEYNKKWHNADALISEETLVHIDMKDKAILLHSKSKTIGTLFEEVAGRKIPIKIFQTESLPGGEGALQAEIVRKLGFEVSLIKDDEVPDFLNDIDMFLMGADRIEPDWIVNKTGSKAIAKMFDQADKPVYVLADSRKIIDKEWPVKSELFEKVPRRLVRGVVTEKGFM